MSFTFSLPLQYGVEKGRAANLIDFGNGALRIRLSSAAVPDEKDDDIILIGPPFYLDLKVGTDFLSLFLCCIQSKLHTAVGI